MANIFQSKEVYKTIRNETNDGNVIIPVYGVYVTGEYKPPYYNNNNGIVISNINTTKATVVDYTERNTSSTDRVFNVLDLTTNIVTPTIMEYTLSSTDAGTDAVFNVLDLTMDAVDVEIFSYSQESVNTGNDAVLNVLDLTSDNVSLSVMTYTSQTVNNTPEPMLRITQITTTKATVVDE